MAGLIVCGKCGRRMSFRKAPNNTKKDYLVCHCRECKNVSSPLGTVEARLIAALREWLDKYRVDWSEAKPRDGAGAKTALIEESLERLQAERQMLDTQLASTFDLLERGIYTEAQFKERSKSLSERISQNQTDQKSLRGELAREQTATYQANDIIPHIEKIMEVYNELESAHEKNLLLKDILEKAVYSKERSGAYRGVATDDFALVIFPKLG
jgi:DNA repair exonuclease SbcCD ATPase subunit